MCPTTDRPRGGRRPEEFPAARRTDDAVISCLRNRPVGATRNLISELLDIPHRRVTYALHRLRARGLVEHIARGCEGHGFWKLTEKGERSR